MAIESDRQLTPGEDTQITTAFLGIKDADEMPLETAVVQRTDRDTFINIGLLVRKGLITAETLYVRVPIPEAYAYTPERQTPRSYDNGKVIVDPAARKILLDNVETSRLTRTEFDLVDYMSKQAGLVLSRQQLLRDVWEYSEYEAEYNPGKTVTEHVRRIRVKFGEDPEQEGGYFETVRGVGYKFTATPDELEPPSF